MQHAADGGGAGSAISRRAGVERPGEGTAAVGAGTWGCGRGGLGVVLWRSVSRAVISDAAAGITAVKKAIDLSKNIL